MTTLDTVFLGVAACALGLFFLLGSIVLLVTLKLLKSIKRVVAKAESVVESVEEATDIIRDASGPLAAVKVVRNIIHLVQRKK